MPGAPCRGPGEPARAQMGGERKNQRRGPRALLRVQDGEPSRGTQASAPVLAGEAGVGRHSVADRSPRAVSLAVGQYCRGYAGRQGDTYLGSGPGPSPTDCISWPFFPRPGSCPLCSGFRPRWFHWGELMQSDKDGKPKVHSVPDSSLANRGGTQCSTGAGCDCPQTSVSATDLLQEFKDLPVFSLCHLGWLPRWSLWLQ